MAAIVRGVLGLDTRPVVPPRSSRAASRAQNVSYLPQQVAEASDFPAFDGSGATVGIIELGGGYRQQTLNSYFTNVAKTPVPRRRCTIRATFT